MRLVIASNNVKKRAEIEKILVGLKIDVVAAQDTQQVEVLEDGESFAANARKKAEAFAQVNALPALADDSGLCVDALQGKPGVYSSRYAGMDASDADNNQKLLQAMQGVVKREAHFICALHLSFADGREAVMAQGQVDGRIEDCLDGQAGFGYDPLFYCHELGKTFAHASAQEKASVSHRGRALRILAKQLEAMT